MNKPVRCRVGEVVRCGRALEVRAQTAATTLTRAVRERTDSDARVAVVADEPGPAHEYVGCIRPAMGLRTRTALAAAARSRGIGTPHDAALAEAREELATVERHETGTANERAHHREAAAAATGETERLRETVAAARGRLQARREQGLDPTPAAEELAAAVERLSEAETEAAAARQRLDTVRERARTRRDSREKQFRLEERVANLERRARTHRREQVHDEYVAALERVPGVPGRDDSWEGDTGNADPREGDTGNADPREGDNGNADPREGDTGNADPREGDNGSADPWGADPWGADPWGADPVARALAVARVAALSAPVVLACDRFGSADAAADWLDAPVIRLSDPR
jgi:hypothetical protein